MDRYLLTGALAIALVGAVQDLRGGRIPNWLTYSGVLLALATRILFSRWQGLESGLLGLLVGGGVFYGFFLLGGMGGGDVKLMAAVGACAGIPQTASVLVAAAIAGGGLAVVYMIVQGRVRVTLLNTAELARHHLTTGLKPHPVLNIGEPGAMRLPYGLAIAIGTLYCVGSSFWGR